MIRPSQESGRKKLPKEKKEGKGWENEEGMGK
jgi:hypothetical protein